MQTPYPVGRLIPHPISKTPVFDANRGGLGDWIDAHADAIRQRNYELDDTCVPNVATATCVEKDEYSDFNTFWDATAQSDGGVVDSELRHAFAMNTCNGCHGVETGAAQFQVAMRDAGTSSALSPFLTGDAQQRAGCFDLTLRHFNDLERRASDLRDFVCPASAAGVPRCGATAIAAGGQHTCATMADGTARCWGSNQSGQLGNGSTTDSPVPTPVSNLTHAIGIAAAGGSPANIYMGASTCAVISGGTIRCWGLNSSGQLGDGTTSNALTPVVVPNVIGAVAVSTANLSTCAVVNSDVRDGYAACWGSNSYGQLGNGTTVSSLTPQAVQAAPGLVPGVRYGEALAAGSQSTCEKVRGGKVFCWGNGYGNTPTLIAISNVSALASGNAHTCAVLYDGTVQCWGDDSYGQLGDGTRGLSPTPVAVIGVTNAKTIAAGYAHTCAGLADGTVACWGLNRNGQLGTGQAGGLATIAAPVAGVGGAVEVAAGVFHTCALLQSGDVECWGLNSSGQLGNGTTTNSASPVLVTW